MSSQHKHAPWRKAVLIPFWCIQLFFELLDIIVLGLAVGVVNEWHNEYDDDNGVIVTDTVDTAYKMYVSHPPFHRP
jgi:hypothetical protein